MCGRVFDELDLPVYGLSNIFALSVEWVVQEREESESSVLSSARLRANAIPVGIKIVTSLEITGSTSGLAISSTVSPGASRDCLVIARGSVTVSVLLGGSQFLPEVGSESCVLLGVDSVSLSVDKLESSVAAAGVSPVVERSLSVPAISPASVIAVTPSGYIVTSRG
jgi:hypothetical protein